MKNSVTIFILTFAFLSATAQKRVPVHFSKTGKSIRSFIPKSYKVLEGGEVFGDLNKDGQADVALALFSPALEQDNPDTTRLLIILLKANDGYVLGGYSDKTLLCSGCGGVHGDPFDHLEIKNDILSVFHFGGSSWRWKTDDKFRLQNGSFYCIGSTRDYYWSLKDCNGGVGDAGRRYKDTNWLTGEEEIIERGEDCKLIRHIKHKVKNKALIKLEAFKVEE